MIDYTLRSQGPKAMVEGVERRNEARRQERLRDQKNRREAIVSNLSLGGLRGQLRDAASPDLDMRELNFFEKVRVFIGKVFEKKKPPAGKYSFAWREKGKIMISWPSHLTPEEREYARKYYNCQMESGA